MLDKPINNQNEISIKDIFLEFANGRFLESIPLNIEFRNELLAINKLLKELNTITRNLSIGVFETELSFKGPLAENINSLKTSLEQIIIETKTIANGDFKRRIHSMGEFANLFNLMVSKLEEARNELNQKNIGLKHLNDELNKDLQLAAEAQRATLIYEDKCSFLESKILFRPYGIVSGDFYEGFSDENGNFNIFVGDATGHGTSAALLTMMFKMAKNSLPHSISTDEIMRNLNKQFAVCMPDEKFITGIAVKITPMGELKASNAGHPAMIIVPAETSLEPIIVDECGIALGMFEEEFEKYTEFEYKLKTGDRVFLPTDGITESLYDGKLLGNKKFAKIVGESRHLPLTELVDNLTARLEEENKVDGFQDDVTLLALEFLW